IGQNRGSYANSVTPDAPIVSMTATDTQTVVIKLSQPVSGFLGLLATTAAGMYFVPKEADAGYDPRNVCIGSGNYMLGSNEASVSLTFKRHEGHYDAARMYLDSRRDAVITEYATGLAQLRTGNIHTFPIRQEDVVGLKKEVSDLNLY